MVIHSPSNKWITTMNQEIADSSRIIREEVILDNLEGIIIVLILILMLSEIQASLRTEETKKAIIIKTKNWTMMTMVGIHIQSQSNRPRIQLLLRNRATSNTEIMMNRRKSQYQRNKNRKSYFLCMRMRETTRMPLKMGVEMKTASSATLVAANLLKKLLWSTVRFARRSLFRKERSLMSKKSEKRPFSKRWKTQITNHHTIRKRHLQRRLQLRNQLLLVQKQPNGRLKAKCSVQLCEQTVPQMMIPKDRQLKPWYKQPWNSMMIALSASGVTASSMIMQLRDIFQCVKRNIKSFRWRVRAIPKEM